MTASPLKKFLVRPTVLSATVFCLLTLPLAALGSNQVAIQLREEPIFHGKLRDVAAPYLGFATALSLGVAIGGVAVTRWRQSSRKSAQLEDWLSTTQKKLKETETQLEELKVSELQLQASGMRVFLEDEVFENQQLTSVSGKNVAHFEAVAASVQVPEIVANPAQPFASQTIIPSQEPVFAARSTPLSVTACAAVSETTLQDESEGSEISLATIISLAQSEPLAQIKELRNQFQQVSERMDILQQIILGKPQSVTAEAEVRANYHYGHQLNYKQQVLESSQVSANFQPARNQSSRQQPVSKTKRQRQKLAAY